MVGPARRGETVQSLDHHFLEVGPGALIRQFEVTLGRVARPSGLANPTCYLGQRRPELLARGRLPLERVASMKRGERRLPTQLTHALLHLPPNPQPALELHFVPKLHPDPLRHVLELVVCVVESV